jgi:hypothetical protein
MRIAIFVILWSSIYPAWAACALSDITIKSMKVKFVDACRRTPCISMKGVAVLTNRCAEPVGVQLKVTGYDKTGAPVATRDLWPASVSNIPPGDYTFSLDTWLDYDPEMKKFDLVPIQVRQWDSAPR